MLITIGFVTYYLIPLSFVLREFSIFLTILNSILLGMLLGLTLVAQALQVGFVVPFSISQQNRQQHEPPVLGLECLEYLVVLAASACCFCFCFCF